MNISEQQELEDLDIILSNLKPITLPRDADNDSTIHWIIIRMGCLYKKKWNVKVKDKVTT